MSNFRKLWGVWQGVSLKAGDTVTVTVVNQYNTFSFDGTKVIRRSLGRPPPLPLSAPDPSAPPLSVHRSVHNDVARWQLGLPRRRLSRGRDNHGL